MEVALLTVGDELLDGDTMNTNGHWLAGELTDRGVSVQRILSLPDDRPTIAEVVTEYSETYDAVIVTGGIGGTPDDVTMNAVADAFDREMSVQAHALAAVEDRLSILEESLPDLDIDIDAEAEAALPAESRPLVNRDGLAPGCVVENVYVFPGIPDELRSMFDAVAGEFTGERESCFLYTVEPEANLVPALEHVTDEFAVTVGCYPDRDAGHNRLKLTGTNPEELDRAATYLLDNADASEEPVSRDLGEA